MHVWRLIYGFIVYCGALRRVCRKSVAQVFGSAVVAEGPQQVEPCARRQLAVEFGPSPWLPGPPRRPRSQSAATRHSARPRLFTQNRKLLYFATHKGTNFFKTAPLQPTSGTRKSRSLLSHNETGAMQTKIISASYSSIMNKQDLLREVVVKYIDYFYPV